MARKADWMNRSSKRILNHSPNEKLQEIGDREIEETPDPVWRDGYVFLGWSLGKSEELERMTEKQERQDPSATLNEAKKKALRKFTRKIRNREPSSNRKVWIDRSEPDVLFVPGERGSGKSFLLRANSDRSALTGVKQMIFDMENEYYASQTYDGIQKSLMMLRDREERQQVDTKLLMPEFVYQARKRNEMPERGYKYMDRFKFGLDILDAEDLDFLLKQKFDDHPDFQVYTSELDQKLKDGEIGSWGDMTDLALEMQNKGKFTYNRRGKQISNYIESNYEGKDFLGFEDEEEKQRLELDLPEVYEEHNRVSLVLNEGGGLGGDLKMKEITVSWVIKKIRNLKERGKIDGDLRFQIEEAHELIPSGTDPEYPPSKKQVRQVIKKDRKRGLSVSMVSQSPTDVQSDNFIDQCRHFLLPQNLKSGPRKKMLKAADVWESGDRQRSKYKKILDVAPSYGWLYIDSQEGTWDLVQPASPIGRTRTS